MQLTDSFPLGAVLSAIFCLYFFYREGHRRSAKRHRQLTGKATARMLWDTTEQRESTLFAPVGSTSATRIPAAGPRQRSSRAPATPEEVKGDVR
jgi:hypothetical protein